MGLADAILLGVCEGASERLGGWASTIRLGCCFHCTSQCARVSESVHVGISDDKLLTIPLGVVMSEGAIAPLDTEEVSVDMSGVFVLGA